MARRADHAAGAGGMVVADGICAQAGIRLWVYDPPPCVVDLLRAAGIADQLTVAAARCGCLTGMVRTGAPGSLVGNIVVDRDRCQRRELPVVDPDATVLEIAALMARSRIPLVAVVDQTAGTLGAVTLDTLLDRLVQS